jgi:hypothetical protein
LMKQRNLPQAVFTTIYANKRLFENNQVKLALLVNPEIPAHIAATLLPQLTVFELLKICLLPGITPDQRLSAERAIIQRIPMQPLGNKMTLARRGTSAIVESLLREGVPPLVEACLDNPHLKEGSVHQFITAYTSTAETISMVARSGRWKGRPNIRLAILKNPRTPAIWYTMFLPGLPQNTIRELLSVPRLTFAQKELVRQALGRQMRTLLLVMCACCCSILADAAPYGIARSYAPVLNISMFSSVFGGTDGKTLKTDRCGQVRELEFIALPGTAFKIQGEIRDGATTVFRVETDDYPTPAGSTLYVDSRVIELRAEKPMPRARQLPAAADIIAALKASLGFPYVWGGNVQGGVAELIELFYGGEVPVTARRQLTLAGLDCSGLLYQATGGWTPRNTSQLVSYGRAVPVAGRPAEVISKLLEPLDLIIWNGHVIIVLDRETTIESRLECYKKGIGGVVTTPLQKRLTEIMRTRKPADIWPQAGKQRNVFVVRRWFVPR